MAVKPEECAEAAYEAYHLAIEVRDFHPFANLRKKQQLIWYRVAKAVTDIVHGPALASLEDPRD